MHTRDQFAPPLQPVTLSQELGRRLQPYGHLRRLPPGAMLYAQGDVADSCFCLLQGRVKAVMLRPDGTEKIIEVLGPGALLGEAAAFDGELHYSSCVTLAETTAYELTVPRLLAAMQADLNVMQLVLRVMSRKQRVLASQVEDMAFLATVDRLVRLLLRLAEDYGDGPPDMRSIRLRITHEQLASMAGCSRVAVTRALGRLRREGGVLSRKGGLLCVDASRLAALAHAQLGRSGRASLSTDQV